MLDSLCGRGWCPARSRSCQPNVRHGEVSDAKISEIGEGKEAMVCELYRQNFPAMSGATRLVERLHAEGFKLAVASSGSEVRRGKPHPEIFLTAAERIGVPPNQCVVVEDATVGIQAARSAGMRCVAILSTGHVESELQTADQIVYSLDEITPEMIREVLTD